MPSYDHRQSGPWHWILFASAIATAAGAPFIPQWQVQAIMFCVAGLFLFLAYCFQHLRTVDRGDHLEVRFGPLPVAKRKVHYAHVRSAEPGTTVLMEGWGIHMSPRGGWVWNIAGWDCVIIRFDKGSPLRVGTNDVPGLLTLLQSKIPQGNVGS